ncbi:hypothetical protein BGI32_04855 [Snodgrassella alvi]|uniref:DUF7480 domain-containing protein n=1 Tax=Snodgrassella alvi TaxID=1196083 RepID=A0A2N9WUI3_9NEIS|nr:putative T6SS immunity periplasmic lipoprotein [Snodgrassella alvi]PIT16257.1 hypothetical protein BGI32_04855 [Snodgrassella alvi]
MKQRLSLWLLINFQLLAITGCYFHRPMVYRPDIVLKKDGQPCISIPMSETRFHSNRQLEIIMIEVVQEGIRPNWVKYYYNLPQKYHIQAQECLHFDYYFQNNVFYTIDFVSTVNGSKKVRNREQKTWDREFRIKKDTDGTVKLLLDLDAREDK